MNARSDLATSHNLYLNLNKCKIILFGSINDVKVKFGDNKLDISNGAKKLSFFLLTVLLNTRIIQIHVIINIMLLLKCCFLADFIFLVKVKQCYVRAWFSNFNFASPVYSPHFDFSCSEASATDTKLLSYRCNLSSESFNIFHTKVYKLQWLNMSNIFKLLRLCLYDTVKVPKSPIYIYMNK